METNDALEDDPALVNTSPEENGWFFKMTIGDKSQFDDALMDEAAYETFCDGLWSRGSPQRREPRTTRSTATDRNPARVVGVEKFDALLTLTDTDRSAMLGRSAHPISMRCSPMCPKRPAGPIEGLPMHASEMAVESMRRCRRESCPSDAAFFLGAGRKHHIRESVDRIIQRGEFTAYTPYQPEIAQGLMLFDSSQVARFTAARWPMPRCTTARPPAGKLWRWRPWRAGRSARSCSRAPPHYAESFGRWPVR